MLSLCGQKIGNDRGNFRFVVCIPEGTRQYVSTCRVLLHSSKGRVGNEQILVTLAYINVIMAGPWTTGTSRRSSTERERE